MELNTLKTQQEAHALVAPRVSRMELVVGIDPAAGGGLARQLAQVHVELREAARDRQRQNDEILTQLREMNAQLLQLVSSLSERVQAVELTYVRK